jgi:heme-degrading monooxygenase HmoA
MMTIVSRVRIKEGDEPTWDDVFRERASAAREQPGFVSVQLAIPLDAPDERVVIGSWQTRADWEAWHNHDAFVETRKRLEAVEEEKAQERWHEVIVYEQR